MSTVEFCQSALKERIAPPSLGSVKRRITVAAREMGWSISRTKDVWYADPRVSIDGDELREIEDKAGIEYGREEAREISELIDRADALLARSETDQNRTLVAAFRAFIGVLDRAGTEG
ncbi:hypothetical protein [Sinorhizobium sp. A49]|uniref:hypothetical protein n=1 Tax=Sinorhizobium sp. A49 TaxID=1945861 RepID=UPI001FD874C8|nr:hypothetical protein [Sinorhizobium sp. A49]